MKTGSISFTGKLTLEDALDINRYLLRSLMRPAVCILWAAVSLLVVALIIFVGTKGHFEPLMIFGLVLFIYYPFGWLAQRWLGVQWDYRRHPNHYLEHTVIITNEA